MGDEPGHSPIEAGDVTGEPVDPDTTALDQALIAHYFSTYCIHADHAGCRGTCKTCGAPCRCRCHREAPASDGPADFESRERAAAAAERRARGRR
jgi:hypothetical protein